MLGFWNRSVYITYFGAFISTFGLLMFLNTNNPDWAFLGMITASVCDMFDGKVARGLKNRSDKEKEFGVQIDSLADIIEFIAVPAFTLYKIGLNNIYQIVFLSLYVVAGVIRLAYFNVMMSDKNKAIKTYLGMPVPVAVAIYGLVWLLGKMIPWVLNNQIIIYTILVPIVGFLHISTFKIKKITGNWFYIAVTLISIVAIILGIFIF